VGFEFEGAMKPLAVVATLSAPPLPGAVEPEQIQGLEDRLLRTEAKVNELEERLDFAERMLTEVRGKPQLPGKP